MKVTTLKEGESPSLGWVRLPSSMNANTARAMNWYPDQEHQVLTGGEEVDVYVPQSDWEKEEGCETLPEPSTKKKRGRSPNKKETPPPMIVDHYVPKKPVAPDSSLSDPLILKEGGLLTTARAISIQLSNSDKPEEKMNLKIQRQWPIMLIAANEGEWIVGAKTINGKYWGRNIRSLEQFISTVPDCQIKIKWPEKT